jgi:hypothetical protein
MLEGVSGWFGLGRHLFQIRRKKGLGACQGLKLMVEKVGGRLGVGLSSLLRMWWVGGDAGGSFGLAATARPFMLRPHNRKWPQLLLL